GLDMSIGEFEAVGDVIKSFASENATVVVGTVIDPDMADELRVTVVVTGLGKDESSVGTVAAEPAGVKLVESAKNDGVGLLDYHHFEAQGVTPKQQTLPKVAMELGGKEIDYWDIRAFLRRQED